MICGKNSQSKLDKKPFWKNKVLYVWSDYYNTYVANYAPSHYMLLGSRGIEDND